MNDEFLADLDVIKNWAIARHAEVNQLYDGEPYGAHLKDVILVAFKHIELVDYNFHDIVYRACWCHDLIEDTRLTYNDVKNVIGMQAADIVYALTNEKGRNRKERASAKYYKGICDTPGAIFVKLCDRIANVQYSKTTNSSMYKKYCEEFQNFKELLWKEKYKPMFDRLEGLCTRDPLIIPPGIIAFDAGYEAPFKREANAFETYNEWVTYCLYEAEYPIHTIEIEGVEWSIGEKVYVKYIRLRRAFIITGFHWEKIFKHWMIHESPNSSISSSCMDVCKIVPLFELPNVAGDAVDIYAGDKYWRVFIPQWAVTELTAGISWIPTDDNLNKYYATKAAVYNYIYENKPAIPLAIATALRSENNYQEGKRLYDEFKLKLKK